MLPECPAEIHIAKIFAIWFPRCIPITVLLTKITDWAYPVIQTTPKPVTLPYYNTKRMDKIVNFGMVSQYNTL